MLHRYMEARKKAGLKREQVAAQLDVSLTTVGSWERGETFPDADKLVELAMLYGVTSDYLLNLDD